MTIKCLFFTDARLVYLRQNHDLIAFYHYYTNIAIRPFYRMITICLRISCYSHMSADPYCLTEYSLYSRFLYYIESYFPCQFVLTFPKVTFLFKVSLYNTYTSYGWIIKNCDKFRLRFFVFFAGKNNEQGCVYHRKNFFLEFPLFCITITSTNGRKDFDHCTTSRAKQFPCMVQIYII